MKLMSGTNNANIHASSDLYTSLQSYVPETLQINLHEIRFVLTPRKCLHP